MSEKELPHTSASMVSLALAYLAAKEPIDEADVDQNDRQQQQNARDPSIRAGTDRFRQRRAGSPGPHRATSNRTTRRQPSGSALARETQNWAARTSARRCAR